MSNPLQQWGRELNKLPMPKQLDIAISHAMERAEKEMKSETLLMKKRTTIRKNWMTKVAVIAVALSLFSGAGYAATKLFVNLESENLQITATSDEHLALKYTAGTEIRKQLDSVKNQLAVGESAVVYLGVLEREPNPLFHNQPGVLISNPYIYNKSSEWQDILTTNLGTFQTYTKLPNGFQFARGFEDLPTGGILDQAGSIVLNQLKEQAKTTGETLLWKKHGNSSPISNYYTSIFENDDKEQIYITYQRVPKESQVKIDMILPAGVKGEKINIAGKEAFYSEGNNLIFNPNDHNKSYVWIDDTREDTILYTVGTFSSNISKSDLELIIKNMK